MFENPDGGYYVTCSDCRKHATVGKNRRKNKIKELAEKNNDPEYRCCIGPHIRCVNSIYPVDKVPNKMFEKSNGEYYTYCLDCRIYNNAEKNRARENKKDNDKIKKELIEKECELEFSYCPYDGHSNVVNSFHPKNLVPISLFRMEPDNPRSELFINCLDCREYRRISACKFINNVKSIAEDKGLHACISCHKLIEHCDRPIKLDGTLSLYCVQCKKDRKQLYDKGRQYYIDTKFDFIKKYQCSCYNCKFIFLKPNDDSLIVRKIATYQKDEDEDRYALIDDKEMHVKDIIKLYYDYLDVSIIELDHLPEKDQRERCLLLPDEIYVPKKENINRILGKASVKLEALKCQHLCMLCHVKETIKREKGESIRSGLIKSKYDYVSKLKEEGCSSCKFTDIDTPRFFDMDHLDISDKIACIGQMCKDSDYSLDDVIKECNKCRVLCKHCHRIHTNKQMKQGLFLPKIKDI
jgi:hypothetical protein